MQPLSYITDLHPVEQKRINKRETQFTFQLCNQIVFSVTMHLHFEFLADADLSGIHAIETIL